MQKHLTIGILTILLGLSPLLAQVTYSEDIAPIIYNNCTSCHREGEVGPMPLTNYQEVASWAFMIEYVTQIKYMPPWKPNSDYSNFVGERGLSSQEIQLIADWVKAGSPQGDPSKEPPLPNFPTGSQLGLPDLVLEMKEEYFIEGNNQDDYRVFVLPTGLTEDTEIDAVEFRADNRKAVHHALISFETNGAAAAKAAEDSTYGYEAFGGFGVPIEGSFTGYTPGIQPLFFPDGIGTTLPANADMLVQIHYAPLATDEYDKSSLNIFFKDPSDSIKREVQRLPITPFDLPGGFFSFVIQPNSVRTFAGTRDIEEDISLMSVYPHAHYLGTNWEMFAIAPTGDSIHIIRIDEWDFNWQGAYTFQKMKVIPKGSVLHFSATYDNTTNNPFNPNNPPKLVRWGEGTADEMLLVGLSYVEYLPGDENIDLGNGVATNIEGDLGAPTSRLYPPYPNPSGGQVKLGFFLQRPQNISIELTDMLGRPVQTIEEDEKYPAGYHTLDFQANQLAKGRYIIHFTGEDFAQSESLIILD